MKSRKKSTRISVTLKEVLAQAQAKEDVAYSLYSKAKSNPLDGNKSLLELSKNYEEAFLFNSRLKAFVSELEKKKASN